jgi:hypothetical protein
MTLPTFEQPVIPEESRGAYTFCPAVRRKPASRCVAAIGHEPLGSRQPGSTGHDFQPMTSTTVRAIERQEAPLERLGYPKPYYASIRDAILRQEPDAADLKGAATSDIPPTEGAASETAPVPARES